MKSSLDHLALENQEHLKVLVAIILEEVVNVEMIILYGSYARGNQVPFDHRVEFGLSTSYRSDYDILVLASHVKNEPAFAKRLNGVSSVFRKATGSDIPVRVLHTTINKMAGFLEKGDFFYSTIWNEGVVLYDTGCFVLPEPRQLQLYEMEKQAKDYFREFFRKGERFLKTAREFDYPDEEYQMASFHLHQACECFFCAISLTFTLAKPKEHDIRLLIEHNKDFDQEIAKVFPRETNQNEHLFELLRVSYIQSRYNIIFSITKEDIGTLIKWVERFRDKTREVCEKKLTNLEQLAAEHQQKYKQTENKRNRNPRRKTSFDKEAES